MVLKKFTLLFFQVTLCLMIESYRWMTNKSEVEHKSVSKIYPHLQEVNRHRNKTGCELSVNEL